MKLLNKYLIIICLIIGNSIALANYVEIKGEKAEVALIKGTTTYIKKGTTASKQLSKGDFLFSGDKVTTQKESRIALKLPDGSFLRFDELTTFEIKASSCNEKERNIDVKMILGKAWAKVHKFFGTKNNFRISAKNAVAGVRGTVYRVNVSNDDSMTVKVYWGQVLVNSQRESSSQSPYSNADQSSKAFTAPTPVLGPHPVEGRPKPVSMEEWTYILKSMQQIVVKSDGSVSKPFSFTKDEDYDDWVKWNEELDKKVK